LRVSLLTLDQQASTANKQFAHQLMVDHKPCAQNKQPLKPSSGRGPEGRERLITAQPKNSA
jgi:hypothetical protein